MRFAKRSTNRDIRMFPNMPSARENQVSARFSVMQLLCMACIAQKSSSLLKKGELSLIMFLQGALANAADA